MLPRSPDTLPSPDGHLATPPFCSIRVGVTFPGGVVDVQVVAYSDISEGGRIVRVGMVGSEGGGEEEEMSGERCGDCEENHFICLQVSCDNQVTTSSASTATYDDLMLFSDLCGCL